MPLGHPCGYFSEICDLGRLQLQLELIRYKRNKFGIRGFSLGIADGIPKKSLECVQIPTVPCDFDGMADGTLDSAGCGLEW